MTAAQLINLLAMVSLVAMMLSIGLETTVSGVVRVARDGVIVARTALANYVLVPALAVGLLLLFDPPPMVAAGILIVAICPGAPFGPRLVALGKGDIETSVGLMVLLAISSAILAPILLVLLIPLVAGGEAPTISVMGILLALGMSQLLPLAVGLLLGRWHAVKDRIARPLNGASAVLNLLTLAVILAVYFPMLVHVRIMAYAGMFALVLGSTLAGWMIGGPGTGVGRTMALTTGARNIGVGLVIVTASLPETPAVTAATAFGIFQIIVVLVVALIWGRAVRTATLPPTTPLKPAL